MQPSTQQPSTQQPNMQQPGQVNTDPALFSKQYLNSKTASIIIAIIIVFIGFIIFFQICSVQSTGCQASGLVGSSGQLSGNEDGDTYNPYCAGVTEFIALVLIVAGMYWLAVIFTTKGDANKLVKGGHILGACAIDAKKGVTATNDLLQAQITLNEQEAVRRGMHIHHIDIDTDSDSSDSEPDTRKR